MNMMKQLMKEDAESYPFTHFVETNIGNPHAFGQKPVTFHRQVLSAVLHPELISKEVYHPDVNRRASEYVAAFKDIGSYTSSPGNSMVTNSIVNIFREEMASQQKKGISIWAMEPVI